jgi:hypothetical protein
VVHTAVGGLHRREGWARGSGTAHAPTSGDQPKVLEAAGDCRADGPRRIRPGVAHQAEQLPRPPVGMAVMGLEQVLEQRRIEGGGRAVGATRLIAEADGPEDALQSSATPQP